MLNSRFAPVIAGTVFVIALVFGLGWLLGLKPQLDKASALRAETQTIKENIGKLEADSTDLDVFTGLLEKDSGTDELLELNAPTRIDVPAARARIATNVAASGAEIVRFGQLQAVSVAGWDAQPAALVSNQVAGKFVQGPVAISNLTVNGVAWTPAVTATTEAGPVAKDIRMLQFDMQLAGTPAEVNAFLKSMMAEDQPLFQVFSLTEIARPASSTTIPGVSNAKDGDILAEISGVMYSHQTDLSIVDEDAPFVGEPNAGAFLGITVVPVQPGAS